MNWSDNIQVFNEDCMEVMKRYPDNYFDLAVVDPPYGGNDAINVKSSDSVKLAQRKTYREFKNKPPSIEYFKEVFRISKNQIIWGVNFYNNYDLSGGRLVWDKKGTLFGRAEIAYLSMTKSVNIYESTWNGMLQADMKNKEIRIHPTQKPVVLYSWIFHNYAKPDFKILDTHGGSLSSAIAWHRYSKGQGEFIGVELDKEYYDAAYKRFKEQTAQLTLL